MSTFRLDRTKFKAQTVDEAADHATYYQSLTWQERLKIANYLNSIAYNHPVNQAPRLDKKKFKARSMD